MFKILVIEDDMSLFQEIKDRLSKWSYDTYGIDDFAAVMDTFINVKPDLVIIDIQLPKFDGFHWCRLIREHSNVPIIFLSSRDHPTDMVMSMQLGADDYIQKPDRKSTRLNSSHVAISYAVFCLKKKKKTRISISRKHSKIC